MFDDYAQKTVVTSSKDHKRHEVNRSQTKTDKPLSFIGRFMDWLKTFLFER
jgi:hypothetical protein